ncbi:MAG: disulfide bond formation protein B [Ilumatobacter sp.]|uniref:disulfide bond formation protein B n=2 Tax=Ilumatobacter sp. TaxID=1967498 RepID=UPI003299D437
MTVTESIQLVCAVLALATAVAAVALAVISVVLRSHRGVRRAIARVARHRTLIVLAIAGSAMVGSLYFSEVAHYVPCTLCWYQRIAMYPIAIVALTALARREDPVAYVAVLAAIGAPISAYHWLVERIPDLESGACSMTVPCNLVWFEKFGFVTLPFMAFVAFTSILVVCATLRRRGDTDIDTGVDRGASMSA